MKLSTLLILGAGLVATSACKKEDEKTSVEVTATLDGKQQVPSNTSAGTGTFVGSYNKNTRLLTYTITYAGFTPVAGHIHQGAPGLNGPHMYDLPEVSKSPITGSATLSEADGASLLAGQGYMNFHSSAYPNGEIRGNFTVK